MPVDITKGTQALAAFSNSITFPDSPEPIFTKGTLRLTMKSNEYCKKKKLNLMWNE